MATFPQINALHVVHQLPYKETYGWVTTEVAMECGKVFTRSENDSEMLRMTDTCPVITQAEVAVLESFFESMGGRLGEFTWTDDNGNAHNLTRFDMDSIDVTHVGPGQYSVVIKLLVQPL